MSKEIKFTKEQLRLIKFMCQTAVIELSDGPNFRPKTIGAFAGFTQTDLKLIKQIINKTLKVYE